MPAASATEIFARKLPEGVAGLHAHGPCRRENRGRSSAVGLRCADGFGFQKNGWSDGLCGTDGKGRSRKPRENSGLVGHDQARAGSKVGTDTLMEVRTKNGLNGRHDFLRSRRANIATGTRSEVFVHIRTNCRLDSFPGSGGAVETRNGGDVRANRNRGERIATENLRRSFRVNDRLNRSTNRRTFRQDWGRERGSREGKMKRRGLFRFQRLQFFLLAILASHFAE